jgi:antitoxin CcdA
MVGLLKGYPDDPGGTGDDIMHTQEEILLEQALTDALKKQRCEQWLAENSEAVNAYNEEVEAHGVFSDHVRSF